MDVLTAIKERRSYRAFTNEPISKETLDQILEAATWAPSPLNAQPWSFVVITAEAVKSNIFAEGSRWYLHHASRHGKAVCDGSE